MEEDIHLTQKIKAKLQAGERLSVMSVYHELKTYELRHYIAAIKKSLSISSEWKTNENTGKRYKEYFINQVAA